MRYSSLFGFPRKKREEQQQHRTGSQMVFHVETEVSYAVDGYAAEHYVCLGSCAKP